MLADIITVHCLRNTPEHSANNGRYDTLFYLRMETLKNHTLLGGRYPSSQYMRVSSPPPPPPPSPKMGVSPPPPPPPRNQCYTTELGSGPCLRPYKHALFIINGIHELNILKRHSISPRANCFELSTPKTIQNLV